MPVPWFPPAHRYAGYTGTDTKELLGCVRVFHGANSRLSRRAEALAADDASLTRALVSWGFRVTNGSLCSTLLALSLDSLCLHCDGHPSLTPGEL